MVVASVAPVDAKFAKSAYDAWIPGDFKLAMRGICQFFYCVTAFWGEWGRH